MGWWRRMRNKLKGKSSARPVRYVGHTQHNDDPFQPMPTYGARRPTASGGNGNGNGMGRGAAAGGMDGGGTTNTAGGGGPRGQHHHLHNALRVPTFGRAPPRLSTEKGLIEESRLSSSLFRPSMMSDRSAYMQEMSFELPRR